MPAAVYGPAAILPRFACFTMPGQHRIARAGEHLVANHDLFPHRLVFSLLAQGFELVVQVEDHRWSCKSPGRAAGVWVKPDYEERLPAERQREMRVRWIGTDALVPLLSQPHVLVRQRLDTLPDGTLEGCLAQIVGTGKDDGEAAK